jgi:hypothetical protein
LPASTGAAAAADENVQFTVYRPRAVLPEQWYPLLAFAHLTSKRPDAAADELDPVEEVQRQAARSLGPSQLQAYLSVTQDATLAVPLEGTLTFVPEVQGVHFNPPRRSFRWLEAVHKEEFRLRAVAKLAGQTARGRLSVYLGAILLADVTLSIRVDPLARPASDNAPPEVERAHPYRRLFASYSHKDLPIVQQFEHFARALGDQYVRDWQHLRAGELWSEQLKVLIRQADVFQLFWSTNAMRSQYVRQEYRYALSLARESFVRPTYWEEPLPSDTANNLPPDELLRLHFQKLEPGLLPPAIPATSTGARIEHAPVLSDRAPWPKEGDLILIPGSTPMGRAPDPGRTVDSPASTERMPELIPRRDQVPRAGRRNVVPALAACLMILLAVGGAVVWLGGKTISSTFSTILTSIQGAKQDTSSDTARRQQPAETPRQDTRSARPRIAP